MRQHFSGCPEGRRTALSSWSFVLAARPTSWSSRGWGAPRSSLRARPSCNSPPWRLPLLVRKGEGVFHLDSCICFLTVSQIGSGGWGGRGWRGYQGQPLCWESAASVPGEEVRAPQVCWRAGLAPQRSPANWGAPKELSGSPRDT